MNTQVLTRKLNKIKFQGKKHAPEILLILGIGGMVTSAIMACKATRKLDEKLEEIKDDIDAIHDAAEDPEMSKEYPVAQQRKDLAKVYAHATLEMGKLYGPAIVIGTLSVTSILASNNIMKKRNVALAAAYATVDKSFKDYRQRVVDRFGADMDKELKYNLVAKEVEAKVTDEKTGKEKTEKVIVYGINPEDISEYARFFEDTNPNWEGSNEYNMYFLKAQQKYANDILQSKGHLFLNEVYDMLGLERTKAGQVVGWVYDEKNPNGDNYVDFGMYQFAQNYQDFVDGKENYILLDFNVDGNVYDYLP